MSSIATAALSDALPLTVPKLDPSGSDWAIFVFRFEDAVEAKGFWGHFDGTVSKPMATNPATPTTAETTAIAQWEKDERSAKSLLTQKLPDSTVVMVHGKATVRERWEAVVKEFSKKSAYAQADMRAKFMAMRCLDKGNPREFLEGLRVRKEELAQRASRSMKRITSRSSYPPFHIPSQISHRANSRRHHSCPPRKSLPMTCYRCSWKNPIVSRHNSSAEEFQGKAERIATKPCWLTSLRE